MTESEDLNDIQEWCKIFPTTFAKHSKNLFFNAMNSVHFCSITFTSNQMHFTI
jgi:hypothetical protein